MKEIPAYLQRDCHWMRHALEEAYKAAELHEIPVGAVIVYQNLAHAEVLCIQQACQKLGSWRLSGCELYVTLEPCPMCSGAIINARLDRVVYGAKDEKAGCCGSVADLFVMPFNHTPIIRSGVLEEECSQLLSRFFAELR